MDFIYTRVLDLLCYFDVVWKSILDIMKKRESYLEFEVILIKGNFIKESIKSSQCYSNRGDYKSIILILIPVLDVVRPV